jgi:hypothetical protein
MGSLTIYGVGAELTEKLSLLATEHGVSLPEEALRVMSEALHVRLTDSESVATSALEYEDVETGQHLFHRVRALVAKYGPLDIELPARGDSDREPPDFN